MTKELTNPNESAQDALAVIIESAADALMQNDELIKNAVTKIKAAIAVIKAEGMTAEYDDQLNKIQVRLKDILEESKDRRSPYTRRMDQVKKAFTELEAMVDPANPNSIYAEVTNMRNTYHAELAEKKKRDDEERARKLKKDEERIRLRSEANQQLRNAFIQDLANAKAMLSTYFNEVTLETFDENEHRLEMWDSIYLQAEFDAIKITLRPVYHSASEVEEIKLEATVGKFEVFGKEYRDEMTVLIRQYRDQLPGKKAHLEAVADAKRKADEAAAEAKKKADAAAAEANEAKRKQMELEAAESQRKAAEQADENARLQKEAADKAEAQRIKEATDAANKEAANKAEQEAKAMMEKSQTLFDYDAAKLEEVPTAKVTEGWEITIKAPSGMLQVFSYYFEHKGKNESVEDLRKRSLDQMITFCEKNYLKTGLKIDSPLVEYKPTYKAAAKR